VLGRVYEETEGNPFFVQQVVALMAEEGMLGADSLSDIAVPDGVREALGRRLDRLSEEADELLKVAAVVGREFPYETLALLHEGGEEELLRLIEEGLDARVIEELPEPGRYQFTHAQMQETLLDELSTTRRVRLHGRIGEALERRWGDRADERASRLARHFVESAILTAAHAEKALHYSKLAAEQAEAQTAWAEAARQYEDCLSLARDSDAALHVDEAALQEALGRARIFEQEGRAAWRALLSAIDIYRGRSDWAGAARASLLAIDVFAPPGRHLALLDTALETGGEREPHLEALLLITRSRNPLRSREEADHDVARAAELAERLDLDDVRAGVTAREGAKARSEGRFDDAIRLARRSYELYTALGDYARAVRQIHGVSQYQLAAGLEGEIEATAGELLRLAQEMHDRYYEEIAQFILADVAYQRGDFEQARALLREAPRGGYLPALVAARLAQVAGERADPEDLLPPPAAGGGVPAALTQIHGARARVYFQAGDLPRARQEFDAWAEVVSASGITAMNAGWTGPALAALGDDETVRRTYDLLCSEPWLRATFAQGADELRGTLAMRLGLVDEAEQHFRTGLEWCERERRPVEAGQCHQGLAEVAVRRGETAEAMRHLDQAAELFQQYGAKLYLDQVIAKKLELQGGAGSSDPRATIDVLTESIDAERPDLASRVAPDGTVTILFSDIEGSTALNVELATTAGWSCWGSTTASCAQRLPSTAATR
jgi:tetratricopeptide (TPR) repeat protein